MSQDTHRVPSEHYRPLGIGNYPGIVVRLANHTPFKSHNVPSDREIERQAQNGATTREEQRPSLRLGEKATGIR